MSRVIRPRSFGGPEVLEVVDVDTPEPGPGDVVVRVRAAGVNPLDWKLYGGAFHDVDDDEKEEAGLSDELPALGMDAAGTIVSIGPDVEGVAVGDDVIVYPAHAAYADHVVAPVASLIPKPAALSWEEAGSLMIAGLTAAHTLEATGLRAGQSVLVHGGAGGVGLMVVQLATNLGARVIATAAPRNHALLRELGATPVAYGPGLADRVREVAPDGIDAAIDTVGTDEALDVSLTLVADPTRIASITGSDRRFGTGIRLLGYGPGQDAGTAYRLSFRERLAELAAGGEVRVVIAETFALADAAAAHRFGQAGSGTGKIVLVP
ncbi:NADP-dependent oxidoreductase [Microbacterium testaceum]|uniref:NADP-dependent oxidoreductase n=1 Tax=Microbacterium testaceum TaxID=2033 RepID=UPI00380FC881